MEPRTLLATSPALAVQGAPPTLASPVILLGLSAFGIDSTFPTGFDKTAIVARYQTQLGGAVPSATIDWGDGTTSAGKVLPFPFAGLGPANGGGDVQGDHTYAKAGQYTVRVTLTQHVLNQPDRQATAVSTAHVLDPVPMPDLPLSLQEAKGVATGAQVVGSFTTVLPLATAGDYTATIDWGDGTAPSAAAVVPAFIQLLSADRTMFLVEGSHTFAQSGTYTAHLTISDKQGHSATGTANIQAFDDPLQPGAPVSLSAVAPGSFYQGLVGTFTDLRLPGLGVLPPTAYTATIDWGDGTPTTSGRIEPAGLDAEIPPAHAVFSVDGGPHTYTQAGSYTIHATVTDNAGDSVTTTATLQVTSVTINATGTTLTAFPGQDTGQVMVASFTADGPALPASPFTATIDWGDGTTTAGTVEPLPFIFDPPQAGVVPGGVAKGPQAPGTIVPLPPFRTGYEVLGHHTYAAEGTFTIHVTIQATGAIPATATSTADVAAIQAIGIPLQAVTGIAEPTNVASFAVANLQAKPGDFSATIDWGDGTTSAGTIQPGAIPVLGTAGRGVAAGGPAIIVPPGTFFVPNRFGVTGSHSYAHAGSYTVKVTIADQSSHTTTVTDATQVAGESLTGTPLPVGGVVGFPLGAASVARFADNDPNVQPSDFRATIDWGDGTPATTGVIMRGPVIDPPIPLASAGAASGGAVGSTPIGVPVIPIFGPSFVVLGNHTYAKVGNFAVHVTISRVGHAQTAVDTKANIVAAPPLRATGLILPAEVAGVDPGPRGVATFTPSSPSAQAGNFTATIDWGDGSKPTDGTIRPVFRVLPLGSTVLPLFQVVGDHAYHHRGVFVIHVTIKGPGGQVVTTRSAVFVAKHP
jgi:PKD repeat protein